MNVGHFLRKSPQPAIVVADGKRIEVPLNRGGKWLEIARTIASLGATKIELLDMAGNVIRAIELDGDESAKETSPELSDVQVFAKLIAEAYEKGTKSYAPLLDSAMNFIERQGQRLATLERELANARTLIAKLQGELIAATATPEPSEGDSVVGAMVAGMLQAQAGASAPAAKPTGNGGARK